MRPVLPAPEPEVPFPGEWHQVGPRAEWTVGPSPGELRLTAGAGADLYAMPGVREVDALPALVRPLDGDFRFHAHVTVEDGGTFADAGGLVVLTDTGSVKVCVERTTSGSWAIVTVVSLPHSDEAMGPELTGPSAELLVTRQGTRFATLFRTPADADWRFARTLTLSGSREVRAGVFAQAPLSDSCTAVFHGLSLSPVPLRDRR
ncbi:DUF1349 domain-containing protein [Streptomyces ipomoeae]|uniref:DUF1349 domain-containing protein n=1 Tax=Streptomyces ipomoeae TaxID=103232 RepID=UPI0011464172|nr:DUF1349 domain-containing protein [Streptomyces ipomoeae]MDX2938366.1 DUF1349 domain-containing protein [Streptomyces ipomoeae]TQE22069.1 DUF1349 domain-containing protein [Streptomyces ipomoeae]